MSRSQKAWDYFVKKGKTTNREIIDKFNLNHGISDIILHKRRDGHIVESERKEKRVNGEYIHWTVYKYGGLDV
jgi:hypothetical protein